MTDNITLPRAVVEQVREALESYRGQVSIYGDSPAADVCTILAAALKEPDATREPATVEQVAEAWWHNIHANFFGGWHEAERFHGIVREDGK